MTKRSVYFSSERRAHHGQFGQCGNQSFSKRSMIGSNVCLAKLIAPLAFEPTSRGRQVAYGAVHVTLDRLVEKGFVTAKMGEPTKERGGRRKRFYTLTGKGEQALASARSRYETSFEGLGWLKPVGA